MPFYHNRCVVCGYIGLVELTMKEALAGKVAGTCFCGQPTEQYFPADHGQLGSDARPTRTIAGSSHSPALQGANLGHEPLSAATLNLRPDQYDRLMSKK